MSGRLNPPRALGSTRRARSTPVFWNGWRGRLQARLHPVLAQVQSRWRGLARRERTQVVLMVAVVAAAVIWLLLTKPALDTLRHWDNELPRLRSQASALKDVLADVGNPVVAGNSEKEPAERVRASLDAGGLADAYQLRVIDSALQIEFKRSADVSRVMTWLLSAPAPLGMTVQQVMLQRSEDSGSPAHKSHNRATVTVVVQRQTGNGS